MAIFRKKPVVVAAIQWLKDGDHSAVVSGVPCSPLTSQCNICQNLYEQHGYIDTLEGRHIVCPGDWIITGIAGEHYPCKPSIFSETYEKISNN